VAFAAPGDTNIDWQVDVLDASNFLSFGKFDTGLPASWQEGDFNYDGVVDVLDAADFFGTGLYDTGSYNPPPGAAGAIAAVPEPSTWAVVAAGLFALGACRRRRPNLLLYLRGDFLCLPFGGQQSGPPHGDVANADWSLVEQTGTHLRLRQTGADTGATVTKTLSLVPGHHAVYAEHVIENLSGRWNYGNHPVLDLSAVPEGTGRIATSAFRFGSVYHGEFSNPANGESGALRPGLWPGRSGGRSGRHQTPERGRQRPVSAASGWRGAVGRRTAHRIIED
jgi:hypothetical protein